MSDNTGSARGFIEVKGAMVQPFNGELRIGTFVYLQTHIVYKLFTAEVLVYVLTSVVHIISGT